MRLRRKWLRHISQDFTSYVKDGILRFIASALLDGSDNIWLRVQSWPVDMDNES